MREAWGKSRTRVNWQQGTFGPFPNLILGCLHHDHISYVHEAMCVHMCACVGETALNKEFGAMH